MNLDGSNGFRLGSNTERNFDGIIGEFMDSVVELVLGTSSMYAEFEM